MTKGHPALYAFTDPLLWVVTIFIILRHRKLRSAASEALR